MCSFQSRKISVNNEQIVFVVWFCFSLMINNLQKNPLKLKKFKVVFFQKAKSGVFNVFILYFSIYIVCLFNLNSCLKNISQNTYFLQRISACTKPSNLKYEKFKFAGRKFLRQIYVSIEETVQLILEMIVLESLWECFCMGQQQEFGIFKQLYDIFLLCAYFMLQA
eukprot:TRINITY_DN14056_c0_g1_i2.p6 TRINITY_DN14056_c0_g1~~TRINITY_DN14056_c0_g1_i2.p6  ORF type:complete len:166 (-),score=1.43 TRINITY_DN14056_c0_g1_i2:230-727(-)